MFDALFAAGSNWDAWFPIGLIWGGVLLALMALIPLLKAIFSEGKKDQNSAQENFSHTTLIGFLAFGALLSLGGFYMKNKMGGGSATGEFKEFVSKEGKFKVSFPGTPREETQRAAGLKFVMYSVNDKDGEYAVAYVDLPISEKESSQFTNTRLNMARDGMLANVRAKLLSEARISLDGKYPGREIRADVPTKNGEMYASLYLVKSRAYMVLVAGKTKWLSDTKTRKFLNSFALRN